MNRVRRSPLLLAFALLAACGGTTTTTTTTPRAHYDIAAVRAEAAAHPGDRAAQRNLAIYEMLTPGGDPAAVPAALDRALALGPDDVLVTYLRSVWRNQHGALDAADEDSLAALEAAKSSSDPLAPFVAEILARTLSIDVADEAVTARRRERSKALFDAPGRLGPIAVSFLGEVLMDDALRRGAAADARAVAQAMGCVPSYRVAGPFGPREQLGFDHEFPASGVGPMAASYDLGPLRGVRPTRELPADGCSIWLGGGAVSGAGTSYAESFVEVPTASDVYVLLSTPNSVVLRVDGTELARLDRRDAPTPRVTLHRVHLAAGRHELEAKITSRHPSPILSIRVVGADGRALVSAPASGSVALRLPAAHDPASIYVGTRVNEGRGDVVAARDAIAALFEDDDASTTVLAAKVSFLFSDPIRPQDRATDEARLALRRIGERDAANWMPHLELAELAANEGRVDEAIDGLRAAAADFPEVIAIVLTLVDLLEQRGFTAEAERRLAALVESEPND